MIKCSLNVRITNAVRTLFHFEALRSKNIDYFKCSAMGQTFLQQHPSFHLLSEWAHMALKDPCGNIIDASILLLRENPFADKSAIMLATLCEEKARQSRTHLAHLIHTIARREAKTIEETALAWFVRFLNVYLEPLLVAASHCGFLISAHQQNTLWRLKMAGQPLLISATARAQLLFLQKRISGLRSNRILLRPRYFCQHKKRRTLWLLCDGQWHFQRHCRPQCLYCRKNSFFSLAPFFRRLASAPQPHKPCPLPFA